ncbi:hypothetical protein A6R70_14580 [Agrobacterium rubi]|uniref:hypothetical protein n=1 Tax=Agrobacterium rubi TaxID=28099 RepID=UPI00201B8F3F|nr:hypothetical protein [Agrobacterium rubi]MCL6653515.1 hypothetical protein [Agrobacterium rubi]
MTWNFDMTAAPRGEEKTTTITVDGKDRTKREYHVAPVWLAWADGKVTRSYWVPESKAGPARWSGCTAAQVPVAWQHFVVPVHPFEMERSTEGSLETGSAEAKNARKAIPETEDGSVTHAGAGESPATHFMLDEVGGGA